MEVIRFGYDGILLNDTENSQFRGAPPGYFSGLYNSLTNYHEDNILNIPKYFAEKLFNINFPITNIKEAVKDKPFSHLIFSIEIDEPTVGYFRKGAYNNSFPYIVEQSDYKTFLKEGKYFLFPYFPNNDYFFKGNSFIPSPPEDVLTAAQKGKCKIVFLYLNEGHVYREYQFRKLYEFARKNNLSSNEIDFYHCNLKIKEAAKQYYRDIDEYINFIPISFFEIDLWFNKSLNRFSLKETLPPIHSVTKSLLEEYKLSIKPKRFLCLNRMARGHRFNICSFLYSQKEINKNSLWSIGPFLGNTLEDRELAFTHQREASSRVLNRYSNIHTFFDDNKDKLLTTGIVLDEPEFSSKNLADQININLYKETYISIVTETEYHEDTIFFSEKVFKPMSVYHPFILLSSHGSLKKLKEFGYKTFDKWWDESYDQEPVYEKRLNLITKLIEELNNKPVEELHSMIMDMQTVLTHNYDLLYSSTNHIELIKMLSCKNVNLI